MFMTTDLIRFTQWVRERSPLSHPTVDDSNWEPDGLTLQVRFCEGGGTYHANGIPMSLETAFDVLFCQPGCRFVPIQERRAAPR